VGTSTRTPLAKPGEVADYLQKPEKTLAEWRYRGIGPKYRTVGRDVRYDWADVDAWLAEQDPRGPVSATPAA
jgi:hypothetical protein